MPPPLLWPLPVSLGLGSEERYRRLWGKNAMKRPIACWSLGVARSAISALAGFCASLPPPFWLTSLLQRLLVGCVTGMLARVLLPWRFFLLFLFLVSCVLPSGGQYTGRATHRSGSGMSHHAAPRCFPRSHPCAASSYNFLMPNTWPNNPTNNSNLQL